jgi:hypothetical protein
MSRILAAWPVGLPMAFFINTVHVILGMGGIKICTELLMKVGYKFSGTKALVSQCQIQC